MILLKNATKMILLLGFVSMLLQCSSPTLDPEAIAVLDQTVLTKTGFLEQLKTINPDFFLPYGKMERKITEDRQLLRQLLEEYLLDEVIFTHAKKRGIESTDAYQSFLSEHEKDFQRYAHELLLVDFPIQQSLSIPDSSIQPYLTQYRVRQILLRFQNDTTNRDLARQVGSSIHSLEDFKHYQKIYPQHSRYFGLDVNTFWTTSDQFDPSLTKIWFQLAKDHVSDPVKWDGGWFLFYGEDSETLGPLTRLKIRYIYFPFLTKDELQATFQHERTSSETLDLSERLLKQIEEDSFAMSSLAQKYSDDASNAEWGGGLNNERVPCATSTCLSWVNEDSIYLQIPGWNQPLQNILLNQISKPFLSSLGYHLFRIEDIKRISITEAKKNRKLMGQIYGDLYEEQVIAKKIGIIHDHIPNAQIIGSKNQLVNQLKRYEKQQQALLDPSNDAPSTTSRGSLPLIKSQAILKNTIQDAITTIQDAIKEDSPFLIISDGSSFHWRDVSPSMLSYESQLMRFISESIFSYGLAQIAQRENLNQTIDYKRLREIHLRARLIEYMRKVQRDALMKTQTEPTEQDIEDYWNKHQKKYKKIKDSNLSNPTFKDQLKQRITEEWVDSQTHIWNLDLLNQYRYRILTSYFQATEKTE